MGMMDIRRRILMDSPHKETETGQPASFTTNSTLPAQKIVVDVGYQQDLNGYDYPWIGGGTASINMIPDTTDTDNGYVAEYILNADGTVTSSTAYYTSEYFAVDPDTVYTLSQKTGASNAGGLCFYDSEKTYISGEAFSKRMSFTVTSPSNAVYCRCIQARKDMKPYVTNQIQMEAGSTATDIKPYSNVCPIIGYKDVPIGNRTINILPLEEMYWVNGVYFGNTNAGAYNSSYKYCPIYIPVKPSTTYNFQYYRPTTAGAHRLHLFDSNKTFISALTPCTSGSTAGVKYGTFTTTADTAYLRIGELIKSAYNYQLTEGESNPTYADVNKTYSAALPFGQRKFALGTLTLNADGTGQFYRTHMGYICDGSGEYDTWSRTWGGTENAVFRFGWNGTKADTGKPAAYETSSSSTLCKSSHFRNGVGINSASTSVGFVAYNSYVQFRPPNAADWSVTDWKNFLQEEYAKGTPLTFFYKISDSSTHDYTLTAPEVRTILGQNNIWSDAGSLTIDYWKH